MSMLPKSHCCHYDLVDGHTMFFFQMAMDLFNVTQTFRFLYDRQDIYCNNYEEHVDCLVNNCLVQNRNCLLFTITCIYIFLVLCFVVFFICLRSCLVFNVTCLWNVNSILSHERLFITWYMCLNILQTQTIFFIINLPTYENHIVYCLQIYVF